MGNSRGVRLPDSNDKKIDEIKDQMGLSFSALISHITDDWLHSRRSKQQRGDITFAAEIIKNFLKHISEADIRKIARANAKYIVEEMGFQANTLDYEEMSRRIMEWKNKENSIEIVR
jgi:5'-deoxynucleotidase YfbR-like HD superfamily hydrolase